MKKTGGTDSTDETPEICNQEDDGEQRTRCKYNNAEYTAKSGSLMTSGWTKGPKDQLTDTPLFANNQRTDGVRDTSLSMVLFQERKNLCKI